eukprot:SAG11_NODE_26109_length_349_cov_1.948000_1_plen_58_part_01
MSVAIAALDTFVACCEGLLPFGRRFLPIEKFCAYRLGLCRCGLNPPFESSSDFAIDSI